VAGFIKGNVKRIFSLWEKPGKPGTGSFEKIGFAGVVSRNWVADSSPEPI